MHLHRALKEYIMIKENFYDPEKPEEYVYDPELIDYDLFFKDLWEKEDNFLKSVGVEPTNK
jgi:hypothetical protein